MSKLDEILTELGAYKLGIDPISDIPFTPEDCYAVYPELKATKEMVKSMFNEMMTKTFLELENSDKDIWTYRDILSTKVDEL